MRADSRGKASRCARGWASRGRLSASASLVMAHGCSSTVDPAVSPAGPSGLACSHRSRRAASDCGRGEEGRACAAGRVPSPPLLGLREASHRVAYIFLTNSALTLGEEGMCRGLDPVTHPTNARLRKWFLLKEVHDDAKAIAAHTCCIMSDFYFLL